MIINKQMQIYFTYLLTFVYIIVIIFKSIYVPLTIDEAYTFLNYVETKDFFNIGIANNHILNTVLIGFTTIFLKNEFFIRLPNFLAGLYYLIFSAIISKKLKFPLVAFFLLTSIPLVFEFFSLARGYGISYVLNFLGIYYFIFSENNFLKKYTFACSMFLVSSFSIHYNIILITSIFLLVLIKFPKYIKNKLFIFITFFYLVFNHSNSFDPY